MLTSPTVDSPFMSISFAELPLEILMVLSLLAWLIRILPAFVLVNDKLLELHFYRLMSPVKLRLSSTSSKILSVTEMLLIVLSSE